MKYVVVPGTVNKKFKNLDLNNAYTLVRNARKGVATKLFYDFAATINMPERDLAELINVSARTISNYKEQQKKLEPIQSEHLLKLIRLFEKGELLFGNIEEFSHWLKKPSFRNTEKPLDWIATPGGVDLVSEELERLAQGYPM